MNVLDAVLEAVTFVVSNCRKDGMNSNVRTRARWCACQAVSVVAAEAWRGCGVCMHGYRGRQDISSRAQVVRTVQVA
jgi:hypothetical protein